MALARILDVDGRLRRVTGAARTESAPRARLEERLLERPIFGTGGLLDLTSSFQDLADLWLEDRFRAPARCHSAEPGAENECAAPPDGPRRAASTRREHCSHYAVYHWTDRSIGCDGQAIDDESRGHREQGRGGDIRTGSVQRQENVAGLCFE